MIIIIKHLSILLQTVRLLLIETIQFFPGGGKNCSLKKPKRLGDNGRRSGTGGGRLGEAGAEGRCSGSWEQEEDAVM